MNYGCRGPQTEAGGVHEPGEQDTGLKRNGRVLHRRNTGDGKKGQTF